MADGMTYCDAVREMSPDNPNVAYHDTQYGFPIHDDNELFGRLILEINQAGLSWTTILRKAEHFRVAYAGFDVTRIAGFGEADRERLLADAGIIRNRLKVDAAIHNAGVVLGLQRDHGSFEAWLDAHHPLGKAEWVKLFRRTFRFSGGEITGEFLMSTGYLPGAHVESCPAFGTIAALEPPWMRLR